MPERRKPLNADPLGGGIREVAMFNSLRSREPLPRRSGTGVVVSVARRSKWLVAGGCVFILAAAQRIAEWSIYGFSNSQGRHLPAAQGTQALVTGVVIAICGAWMIFVGMRRKSTSQADLSSAEPVARSSSQTSRVEASQPRRAAAQQADEADVE